jgi:uncharacterized membrane protein
LKTKAAARSGLEQVLAVLLQYGTYLASAVVALGWALAFESSAAAMRVASTGIALFILLPVARVGVMLIYFLYTRAYRFGAISALVLSIIFLSFTLGAR